MQQQMLQEMEVLVLSVLLMELRVSLARAGAVVLREHPLLRIQEEVMVVVLHLVAGLEKVAVARRGMLQLARQIEAVVREDLGEAIIKV